jgi:hypothetical protein
MCESPSAPKATSAPSPVKKASYLDNATLKQENKAGKAFGAKDTMFSNIYRESEEEANTNKKTVFGGSQKSKTKGKTLFGQ